MMRLRFNRVVLVVVLIALCDWSLGLGLDDEDNIDENQTDDNFTSSEAPQTTKELTPTSSPPVDDTFYVKDSLTGNICLLLRLNTTFILPYYKVDGKKSEAQVYFNHDHATSVGMCSNTSITLSLHWLPPSATGIWMTDFTFVPAAVRTPNPIDNTLKKYQLANLTLSYELDNATFPNTNFTGANVLSLSSPEELASGTVGETYKCFAKRTAQFINSGAQMELKDFQVDAFRTSNSTDFSAAVWHCDEDISLSNVIPIIVGVTLALLVVIFLVAYIFGRVKTNHSSYQSM